jgi:tRNA-binding protein
MKQTLFLSLTFTLKIMYTFLMATFDDFMKLDIRVGEIVQAEVFEKAKKPAYQLLVDFGSEIGVKKSSAQITELYAPADLIGKQVLGVVNFPPRQIADFISEVLVLGVYTESGVVLITTEQAAKKGDKLG